MRPPLRQCSAKVALTENNVVDIFGVVKGFRCNICRLRIVFMPLFGQQRQLKHVSEILFIFIILLFLFLI